MLSGSIATQSVGSEFNGFLPLGFQELNEESLGGARIFTFLNQDIDDITILVHRSPQIPASTLNRHGHFIEEPTITTWPMRFSDSSSVVRPEGCTPLADSFVGDSDATFCEQVFYVSKAKCESMIEPHGVGDDVWWEAISTVA